MLAFPGANNTTHRKTFCPERSEPRTLPMTTTLTLPETNGTQFLTRVERDLQKSLNEGWKTFCDGPERPLLATFMTYLLETGFYQRGFEKTVPNPAYDNAAKLIGRRFLDASRHLGLHYDALFPGRFDTSREYEQDGYEVRQFFLDTYYNGGYLCRLSLAFPHTHGIMDFPVAPRVRVERE
jgi:hypothetical protein